MSTFSLLPSCWPRQSRKSCRVLEQSCEKCSPQPLFLFSQKLTLFHCCYETASPQTRWTDVRPTLAHSVPCGSLEAKLFALKFEKKNTLARYQLDRGNKKKQSSYGIRSQLDKQRIMVKHCHWMLVVNHFKCHLDRHYLVSFQSIYNVFNL